MRPSIVCLVCREVMRVHHSEYSARTRATIVAVECRCGRVIASISDFYSHATSPLSSNDLNTAELDAEKVGRGAREEIAHHQQCIADFEKWIAAATWVRARPRSESAS